MSHIHHFFILAIFTLFTFAGCKLLGGDDDNSPIPGKIVFAAKDNNGDSQIFTMKANGENVKQLTHFPPEGEAYSPSWSPDGEEIIFTSFKGGISTGPAIWVMDADGSNQRYLYHPDPENEHANPIIGNNPKWSPDGTKVAFDLCLNCQIYTDNTIWVFDTLTKELTQLTPHEENPGHPASDLYPSWSPDGSQIIFTSNRDYVNGDTLRFRDELYIMNENGTNQIRITENGYVGLAIWNSGENDMDITFRTYSPISGVYQLDNQTDEVLLLLEDPSEYVFLYPQAWSPDTSRLLLKTFERDPKPAERSTVSSLLIFNTQTGEIQEILSKTFRNSNPAISSADWHVPEEK